MPNLAILAGFLAENIPLIVSVLGNVVSGIKIILDYREKKKTAGDVRRDEAQTRSIDAQNYDILVKQLMALNKALDEAVTARRTADDAAELANNELEKAHAIITLKDKVIREFESKEFILPRLPEAPEDIDLG